MNNPRCKTNSQPVGWLQHSCTSCFLRTLVNWMGSNPSLPFPLPSPYKRVALMSSILSTENESRINHVREVLWKLQERSWCSSPWFLLPVVGFGHNSSTCHCATEHRTHISHLIPTSKEYRITLLSWMKLQFSDVSKVTQPITSSDWK